MCTAVGLAAVAEAKRPGRGVPGPAHGAQEAGDCSNLPISPGWEAGARPVITRRGQRGQPASDGLMTSCVHGRQGGTGRLHTGETEAASPQGSSRAAEASSVHFWAPPPPPEAVEAALSDSTAGLKLMSGPPPPAPPLPTNSHLPRVTSSAATGPGGCITKAHWPAAFSCLQALVWSPGPVGWAAAFGQCGGLIRPGAAIWPHKAHLPTAGPLGPTCLHPGWWEDCFGGAESPSTGISSSVLLTSLHWQRPERSRGRGATSSARKLCRNAYCVPGSAGSWGLRRTEAARLPRFVVWPPPAPCTVPSIGQPAFFLFF